MISPRPSNEIDSEDSLPPMNVRFNTFEQCNGYIKFMDEMDLDQYLDIVRTVPYDNAIIRYSNADGSDFIEPILRYFITISKYDYRAFEININSLEEIGFDLNDYSSKSPKWIKGLTRAEEKKLDREQRFLKKNKLVENVDYIAMTFANEAEVEISGFHITRLAIYKIVSKKYGITFLESIVGRMGKILYFFNEYKRNFRSSYIESLQRTINGLNDDIKELNELSQLHKHNDDDIPKLSDPDMDRYSIAHSNLSRNSYVSSDAIMDTKTYIDEISTIHTTMENMISKVDGRISNVDYKLASLAAKIDDLVGSIALTKDECRSSVCCSRCSSIRQSNPVLEHMNGIFRDYEKISNNKPRLSQRRSRREYISNEFEQEL